MGVDTSHGGFSSEGEVSLVMGASDHGRAAEMASSDGRREAWVPGF